jgi:hypothetical protein
MKTTLESLRHSINIDRMQENYTKEQLIQLIDLLLIEREQSSLSLFFAAGESFGRGTSDKNFEQYLEHFKIL